MIGVWRQLLPVRNVTTLNIFSITTWKWIFYTLITYIFFLLYRWQDYYMTWMYIWVTRWVYYNKYELLLFETTWVHPRYLVEYVLLMVLVSCVLCTQCCQCRWIVHSWLSLRFSRTFIYILSNISVVFSYICSYDFPIWFLYRRDGVIYLGFHFTSCI